MASLLFAAGLFLIGDRRMLFTDTFQVYAEFTQIAALDTGAKVRVRASTPARSRRSACRPVPSGRFRVQMRVRSDLRPLIRLDSVASIQNDGLVGNKFVQIQTGTDASPQVADQGTIQSREPFDIADLMLDDERHARDREHDARRTCKAASTQALSRGDRRPRPTRRR